MCGKEARAEEASLSICSDEDRPWREDEAQTYPYAWCPALVGG